MGFDTLKQAREREQGESNFIGKEDLVGEIIAVDIVDFDAQHDGKYGIGERIIVDLIVVTGEHARTQQNDTHFFGGLAKQLFEAAGGEGATVVRVTSGPSRFGTKWYGADPVSDKEFGEAQEVVAHVTGAGSKKKNGAKAPF